MNLWARLFGWKPTVEKPSPKIRISEKLARELKQNINAVFSYENCFIAAVAPSNSMEPGIDDGMYVVLDPSVQAEDLGLGDIIWYVTDSFQALHRIISIGYDPEWYCITQGDNNSLDDDIRIRANQVKGVWRCTLN